MKSTLSSAIFFCSVDSCSATFDNEEKLMDHEQKAEHFYTDDYSVSTIDRAQYIYIYIEHLKGARLLEEASNRTAIESLQNSNIENIQFSDNDDELKRKFSSQGKQQDKELEDFAADEVNNALKCCSDNEYDTD
ncbi:unnamed protein product [Rotaria sordida]|uniref:C2H2-type domain-containing protein n=1 Tax=Rotaria sordida TaxID=392033 RepID=A0A818SAK5_9BILA|nr:unnamed protein product [Rotaria sordida]CAF3664252.1 unnamed protein product [Rotaria sordida]